ncbi:hypothetical protein DH09_12235 [Bacillaceae bacterium JMAK1]|nr:hypothetical protein DH09_12235 [Bacillaceae bacterium JMAK1]
MRVIITNIVFPIFTIVAVISIVSLIYSLMKRKNSENEQIRNAAIKQSFISSVGLLVLLSFVPFFITGTSIFAFVTPITVLTVIAILYFVFIKVNTKQALD